MTSHFLNQCWNIVNWTRGNKFQWNFNQNQHIFNKRNAFENIVCKMASILSWPQCVKITSLSIPFWSWGNWQGHWYTNIINSIITNCPFGPHSNLPNKKHCTFISSVGLLPPPGRSQAPHLEWWLPQLTEWSMGFYFNSSSPRQNGRHFADDIFKCILMNEKCISIRISLKFVLRVQSRINQY